MRYFFLIYFCGELVCADGQIINPSTPSYFSRLNCYSRNFVDVFSITGNPAAVVQLNSLSVGVGLEQRFMIGELRHYIIAGILPTRLGGFGFQLNYFGSSGYREIEPGIAFAKELGTIDLGIKFNYRSLNIPGYGGKSSLVPELGTTWHLSEKIHTGIRIYHPVSTKNEGSERFGYTWSSGVGYELSTFVFLGISIIKEEERDAQVGAAIIYHFGQQFFARMGISTPEAQFRFGAGWKWNSLRVDVSASWHFRLGMSPGFQLIYQPAKMKSVKR